MSRMITDEFRERFTAEWNLARGVLLGRPSLIRQAGAALSEITEREKKLQYDTYSSKKKAAEKKEYTLLPVKLVCSTCGNLDGASRCRLRDKYVESPEETKRCGRYRISPEYKKGGKFFEERIVK